MSSNGTSVSRASGAGHNTINRRRVAVYFQRFPGTNAASGIAGLDYTIIVNGGAEIGGVTPADGKIEILLAASDTATLQILDSAYEVSLLAGGLHPVAELRGTQKRLNMLGYNAGTIQADNTPSLNAGIETQSTLETELAITNFQSDNNPLFIDAIAGPNTQKRLRNEVRNNDGE